MDIRRGEIFIVTNCGDTVYPQFTLAYYSGTQRSFKGVVRVNGRGQQGINVTDNKPTQVYRAKIEP